MAVELVLRNGTAAENDGFTGALAEVTVDNTNKTLRVHDGSTPGGTPLLVGGSSGATLTDITLDGTTTFSSDISGDLIPSSDVTFDLGSPTNRWNDLYLSGNTIDIGGATISVVGGSFEFKDSSGNDAEVSLAANTTDDLAEGTTNLYYLDSRVDDHLSGGTGVTYSSGTISIGQPVGTSDNVTFNDVTVDGDLIVNGSSTTLNTTTLDVEDLNITVASGAVDSSSADGAGLTVDGANATLTYSNAGDRFVFNKDIEAATLVGQVSDISNHDTDDLTEGTTNLYYTDTRVRNAVSATTGLDYDSATGVFNLADTTVTAGTFGSASEVPVITVDAQGRITSASTINVAGVSSFSYDSNTGDLDIGTADGSTFTATVDLGPFSTDNLTEGSNLYYTDARVDAHLSGGTGVSFSNGTISIGQPVGTTDNVAFNDVTVNGDLTVSGTTTSIDTNTLNVEDINVTVANGATSATAANGAGLTADLGSDGVATFTYDSANDRWSMNKTLDTDLIGNVTGDVTGSVSDISNHDTDDLTEGTTNLYYTDTRVRNAVSASGDLTFNSSTGTFSFTERTDAEVRGLLSAAGDLNYNSTTGEFSVTTFKSSDFDSNFAGKSTSDLSEGSNLYYTDARVDAHLNGGSGIDFSSGTISHSDTSSVGDVTATSNTFVDSLTFDEFGHVTAVSTSTAAPPNDATITVSAGTGLNGGGNFTTDQSGNETISLDVDTSTIATRSYVDTEVANLVDSSPSTLDTLNELAAALGDDPNFATTVANDIGEKADKTIDINAGSGLTGGGDLSSNRTISHADTSSVSDVSASSNTFVDAVTFDTFGHVQTISTSSVTPPNNATITINAGNDLSGGGSFTTDQSGNETITIDHGNTSNLSGTYGSASNSTKIDNITVDSNGHVTSITTGATGDVTSVNAGSGLSGGGSGGSVTVSHADTSSQGSVNNSGNTVIQDITLDGFGHITGLNSTTISSGAAEGTDVTFDSIGVGTAAPGTSGELQAAGDIIANASDDRLKNRLGDIDNALGKVESLSGFYFEFNDTAIDLGLQEGKRVGVSAQEVQSVLPEVVKDAPVDNEYLTVQYEKMVPLLIEAIKEQSTTIEELKTRINTLEEQTRSH